VIVPVVLALDLEITVRFILVTLATGIAFGGTCIGITGAKAFYATGMIVPSTQNTGSDAVSKILQSQLTKNQTQTNTRMSLESPKLTPPGTTDSGA